MQPITSGGFCETFPGVFSGIGEFSIHKEFVSSKVAGGPASLRNPALDRILDFAGEVGLIVLIHNDLDVPFAKPGTEPAYLSQMKEVLARHPKTTIIWAHTGMGRIVRPVEGHAAVIEAILKDPAFSHVYFDISWDEVAKYLVATEDSIRTSADLINRYPDRFLFGTDEVAPASQDKYLKVYEQYTPLWKSLNKETSDKVRKGNYERLFDEARRKVRAWEASQGGPVRESALKERTPRIQDLRDLSILTVDGPVIHLGIIKLEDLAPPLSLELPNSSHSRVGVQHVNCQRSPGRRFRVLAAFCILHPQTQHQDAGCR